MRLHESGTYELEDDGSVYEGEFVNGKRYVECTYSYGYAIGDVN